MSVDAAGFKIFLSDYGLDSSQQVITGCQTIIGTTDRSMALKYGPGL